MAATNSKSKISEKPVRMITGCSTGFGCEAKLEELRKEFSAWETVSRGADFPKDV